MNPLKLILALSALLICAQPILAQSSSPSTPDAAVQAAFPATSSWKGAVTLPNQKELKVELRLQQVDAQWQGRIAIPQQGAKDLALRDIRIEGRDLSFRIADVKGSPTFVGRFDAAGRTVKGEFSQGSAKMPFAITQNLDGLDSDVATSGARPDQAGKANTASE